jgi:hypothetical protein
LALERFAGALHQGLPPFPPAALSLGIALTHGPSWHVPDRNVTASKVSEGNIPRSQDLTPNFPLGSIPVCSAQ